MSLEKKYPGLGWYAFRNRSFSHYASLQRVSSHPPPLDWRYLRIVVRSLWWKDTGGEYVYLSLNPAVLNENLDFFLGINSNVMLLRVATPSILELAFVMGWKAAIKFPGESRNRKSSSHGTHRDSNEMCFLLWAKSELIWSFGLSSSKLISTGANKSTSFAD